MRREKIPQSPKKICDMILAKSLILLNAPRRNRTYNLVIKSQRTVVGPARTRRTLNDLADTVGDKGNRSGPERPTILVLRATPDQQEAEPKGGEDE
jgi:hypothetical protein